MNAAVVVTAASAIVVVFLYASRSRLVGRLCREDGIVENLTAAMYFAAAAIFVYTCATFRFRNLVHWGYAGLFFLVGGEEISWGQRIFGIATPEKLRTLNVQGEMNLHNVKGVHGDVRWVGLLVVLIITVVMPLAFRFVPRARSLARRFHVPVFPLAVTPIVVIAIALMAGPRVLGRTRFGLDEMGEFYLALAFLMFGLAHLSTHRLREGDAAGRVVNHASQESEDDELLGATTGTSLIPGATTGSRREGGGTCVV